ncbi:MAG: outer membrane beta-barrel protein [Gemmatimonadota bacterium]
MRARQLSLSSAAILGLLITTAPASAQVEIGVDAGLTSTRVDGSRLDVVQVDIPVQRLRVGFFVTPTVQLEPSIGYSRVEVDGIASSTLQLGTDLLVHLGRDPYAPQVYIAAGPSLLRADFGAGEETQVGVGGDLGLKLPAGGWMAVRLGVGYTRWLENDTLFGADEFGAFFGFSVFTR